MPSENEFVMSICENVNHALTQGFNTGARLLCHRERLSCSMYFISKLSLYFMVLLSYAWLHCNWTITFCSWVNIVFVRQCWFGLITMHLILKQVPNPECLFASHDSINFPLKAVKEDLPSHMCVTLHRKKVNDIYCDPAFNST